MAKWLNSAYSRLQQVVQAIASKHMTVDAACVLAHAVLHANGD
jgi:hypothetical protein